MGTSVFDSLAVNDLIGPGTLEKVVEELGDGAEDSFVLKGSLLDYMIDETPPVLEFEASNETVTYEFDIDWPSEFSYENQSLEQNRIRDGFLRAGIESHETLPEVMEDLRSQDDVILGIDGNILRDCVMTSTLLEEIYKETYPNWILIAIPRLVMSQVERAAKNHFVEGNHPRVGWPTYDGRVGQRALREVMKLREKNPERQGLAVMTVGEIKREGTEEDREDWKSDALIRDQFKQYLDDIGFHKGTFFLSQNRVNVMMSGTEGGDTLYLEKPEYDDVRSGEVPNSDFAKLLYELCLQFGSIQIGTQDGSGTLALSIYWPGKHYSDWNESKLNVESVGL